jgi:predicted transposase/invertase (TIGR01784 family)
MKSRFVNPFTDFGFKKLFGEEASKNSLCDFLNSLLPENNNIITLSFRNTEQLGQTENDRKAVYDIYCENGNGEKFIVELQKAKQNFFKDRTIYYSTFPIQEQAEKGEWNYKLNAVYCIGILDFTFDDYESEPERSEVVHTVQLKDQNNKLFFDKLKYVYLEMPNFKKNENELITRLDKWLFFIKNLEDFRQIPEIFKEKVFEQAFETAELAKYTDEERLAYENSLKIYRDLKGVIETAFDDGKTERNLEVGRIMKSEGETIEKIIRYTGLSKDEIEKL